MPIRKEMQWWNEEVQEKVREKEKCKKWKDTGDPLVSEAYKVDRKKAMRTIAKAKNAAMTDLCQRLETKEAEGSVQDC